MIAYQKTYKHESEKAGSLSRQVGKKVKGEGEKVFPFYRFPLP
jgi:hypothetical protein